MGKHIIHIEIDDEDVYRAFKQWKKDGRFPTMKLAFYNFSEIRERSGTTYMQIKPKKQGKKLRGRGPKYIPSVSAMDLLQHKAF